MAKRGKARPQRKSADATSLSRLSAESLGRIIGRLQRELDDAAKQLPRAAGVASSRQPGAKRGGAKAGARTKSGRKKRS